jgi:hypothetical protein
MAKYGASAFVMSFGGTDITAHIQSINAFDIEAITEDSKSFGDTWGEVLPTGDKQASDVEIEGFYDDAAGGPVAVLQAALAAISGPATAASAVVLTWGGGKTSSFNAFCVKFSRIAQRNQITRYRATVRPTGAVTEA